MRCAVVLYFVVTVFVDVYSVPELCVFKDYGEKAALCGTRHVEYTFDFIPPIDQYISFITLWGQPLQRLPYNGFRNLTSQSNISEIWVRDCQISYVDAGALLNLHNLTAIDLSWNKIEVLPSGLFQNLTLLKVVDLEYNRIRQVQWFSFKNTPSLRRIYLNNNRIELMNIMLFEDKFDNLTTLSLYANPWRCNCELGQLYEFLVKINQLNQYGLACEKPPSLQGRKLSDINRDKFVCRPDDAISAQDLVMVSTEQVNTGTPEPPSDPDWIEYTRIALELMCVAAVIMGVVFVVRHTLAKSNRNCQFRLPTCCK